MWTLISQLVAGDMVMLEVFGRELVVELEEVIQKPNYTYGRMMTTLGFRSPRDNMYYAFQYSPDAWCLRFVK